METTFKVHDRVRVTPEYAAWYRSHLHQEPGFTPDSDIEIEYVYDKSARVKERGYGAAYWSCEVPLEYLVSVEEDATQ